jgi:hypothetical protein
MWKALGFGVVAVVAAQVAVMAEPELPESASPTPVDRGKPGLNPFDRGGAEGAAKPVSRSQDIIDPFDRDRAEGDAQPSQTGIGVPEGFATLRFKNAVGGKYKLLEAHVIMDGASMPMPLGAEPGQDGVFYNGKLRAGRHVVSVRAVYQGQRRGPFDYMKGYTLNVESEQVLTIPAARPVSFTIVVKDRKGMNVSLDKGMEVTVQENTAARPQ